MENYEIQLISEKLGQIEQIAGIAQSHARETNDRYFLRAVIEQAIEEINGKLQVIVRTLN